MSKIGTIQEKFARLTLKIEVGDSRPFTETDFNNLVQEAVRSILGSFGPDFRISGFDEEFLKGSIIAPGKDIQQIWAALSAFGMLFNRRLAIHFNALTEYVGEV